MQRHLATAVRLFAWADTTREAIGDTRPPVEQAEVDRDLITIHSHLDETVFSEAYAEGRAMSMEQAIADALNATAQLQPTAIPHHDSDTPSTAR
jgi:hypothetical protein